MAHLVAGAGGEVHERLARRRPDAAAPCIGRRVAQCAATLAITAALGGCLGEGGASNGALIDDDGRRLDITIDDPRVEFARHVPVVVTLDGSPWPDGARIELLLDGETRAHTEGPGPSWVVELPIRDERDDGAHEVVARAIPIQGGGATLDSNVIALEVDVPPGGTIVSQVTLDDPCWPRVLHVDGGRATLAGQFDDVVRGDTCVLLHEPHGEWVKFPSLKPGVPYGRPAGVRLVSERVAPWAPTARVVEVLVHASAQNLLDDSQLFRFVWAEVVDEVSGSPFVDSNNVRLGASRITEQAWFTDDGVRVLGWGRDDPESGGPFRGMVASLSRDGDVRWNRTWPGPTPNGGEVIFFAGAMLDGGAVATLSRTAGRFEVLLWSSEGDLVERFPVPGVTDIFEPGGFAATRDGTLFAAVGEIAPMYANDTELVLIFDREGTRFGATRPSRDRTTARGVAMTEDAVVFLRAHDCTIGDFDIGELVDCTLEVDVRERDGTPRWSRSFEALTPTGLGARGGDNGAAMFVDRDGYVWIAASAYLAEPIEGFEEGFVWLTKLHP